MENEPIVILKASTMQWTVFSYWIKSKEKPFDKLFDWILHVLGNIVIKIWKILENKVNKKDYKFRDITLVF